MYQIKIQLLSDLCVSDGGVYNSMLDTDICYDSFGFPYIPAKRLRGCLRECAIELKDWGVQIEAEKLFGKEGYTPANIRFSDAYLEDYETKKQLMLNGRNSLVLHPQNILNHYSYIRTQTSIDYETGTAEPTSLRTMRVAKKGLIFFASVEFSSKEAEKEYSKALEQCCTILKHMGVARTRGLGEVQVTLHDIEKEQKEKEEEQQKEKVVKLTENADYLEYCIQLEEPLICKSIQGGEARTLDYIEGSKVLGLVAGQLKKEQGDLLSLLNAGEVFFSNAYPMQDGVRFTEVPATYYQIKNEKEKFVDKAYETEENKKCLKDKQLNQMKHCYVKEILVDGVQKLQKYDVTIEERYHHRRPEDKSIGRAMESISEKSHFYQISSITAGQSFGGYITGTKEQIKIIYELLQKQSVYYMGFGRMSEYGKVRFKIQSTEQQQLPKKQKVDKFQVQLVSPVILYGDNAMYTTNAKILVEEMEALLGLDTSLIEKVERYVNYTSVGGYNVTWQARKPVIDVFDKGTVCIFSLKEPVELPIGTTFFVGERITEGFGEVVLKKWENNGEQYIGELIESDKKKLNLLDAKSSDFVQEICEDLFSSYLEFHAMNHVSAIEGKDTGNATVNNMLLMCKEANTIEEVENYCKAHFEKTSGGKQQKLEFSKNVLTIVKRNCQTIVFEFCTTYGILENTFLPEKEQYQMEYLKAYLYGLKYQIRKSKVAKEG